MLSIRLQRTGRRKRASFRMVVQDSRRAPTSGKVVANLGHYDPHTKEHGLDFDQVDRYLTHGARPSRRVIKILKDHDRKLPAWVKDLTERSGQIKSLEKLRRNRPPETEATKDEADQAPTTKDEPNQASSETGDAEPESKDEKGESTEPPETNQEPATPDQPKDESKTETTKKPDEKPPTKEPESKDSQETKPQAQDKESQSETDEVKKESS